MQELLTQADNVFLGMDWQQIFSALKYIISVIVGGVGYKYIQLYLNYKKDTTQQEQSASENLITNLEDRIKALTERVSELENKREESYQRELKVTKMLAKAEQKVETLEEKVQTLERNQKVLERTVDKYYKKYGPLDEVTEEN